MSETVLIVGSGAREHAIAAALARSKAAPVLACVGSTRNPGLMKLCKHYTVAAAMPDPVVAFAREVQPTLAIVGPEGPLAAGVVDALLAAGIPAVGPTQALAQIEASKSFARRLLVEHNIVGNPRFRRFTAIDGVGAWLDELGDAHVIKDDGLAGGKGVRVFGDHLHSRADSLAFCKELIATGRPFVIEEKLEGEEFSLLSFSDGATVLHMPPVRDHKRAFDGDTGPNTGGMGTYTDRDGTLPFLTDADIHAAQAMNEAVVAALRETCGAPYRGILYGGFMATANGVRLIEYNARFGDPESLNLLTLLESDFLDICLAIAHGTLDSCEVRFRTEASVCKYIVPNGYPDAPEKGARLHLPEADGVTLFMGSVDERDGELFGAGSRAVAAVALGGTLDEAERKCQQWIDRCEGPFFFRRDIATAPHVGLAVDHMQRLRSR